MFCPNCGNKINDENKFCPNCGFEINTHNKNENGYDTKIISSDSFSSNDKADNIFKRLVCAYISRDASGRIESNATNHYYSVFSKLDLNPNSFTWNWGAFFFGPLNFFL